MLTFNFGSFRAGMIPVWLLFAGHGADRIAALFATRRTGALAWRDAEAHRALGQLLEETDRAEEAQLHYRSAQELESGARRPRRVTR